jgi:polyhydroxyalkanoate synthesis regulator phasin
VKLNTTTLGIPLAIALLVGAAGAVMATSGGPSAPEAQDPAAASPIPTPSSGTTVKPPKPDSVLSNVLDGLVTKGTINTTQKTAILDAVTAERAVRREARQEARKAAKEQAKADRQQLKGFLADGVITKEEFDKLPADSLLRTMTGLMDDGKITTDELRTLGRGFMGGKGNGPGWFGKDKAPKASPSPSAGTSG